MRVSTLVLLLAGCRHARPPGNPTGTPSDTGDGPHPTATSTTAEAARGPWVTIEPAVSILGEQGQELGGGGLAAFPASGGLPGVLFVPWGIPYGSDLPLTFILSGVPPRGEHGIYDVWDGVSGWMGDVVQAKFHLAGDENGDGIRDAWIHDSLFPGPLLGRRLEFVDDPTRIAWFDGGYEGLVVAAGFDADRDGHDDVAVMRGYQRAVIYYGPFSGKVRGVELGEAPLDQVTFLGEDGCPTTMVATLLEDHLGPGHPALATGDTNSCDGPDTVVYDLWQPRGGDLSVQDCLAFAADQNLTHPRWLDDAGDLDGDGHPDVLWSRGSTWKIPASPLSGWFSDEDAPVSPLTLTWPGPGRSLLHAIGDLNGDGVQELTGTCSDEVPDGTWAMILFSPFQDPLDPCLGLPIGPAAEVTRSVAFGETHADLDGDGLQDVVGWFKYHDQMKPPPPPEWIDAGEVRIWYGRDLWAAEQARQDALEPF